ncbi:MAG: hypothetical protein JWL59_1869 [Chthoniobacteraceae bacterium]|nr:hypothetical protein [Chthoniobacteraceae bacterium]
MPVKLPSIRPMGLLKRQWRSELDPFLKIFKMTSVLVLFIGFFPESVGGPKSRVPAEISGFLGGCEMTFGIWMTSAGSVNEPF